MKKLSIILLSFILITTSYAQSAKKDKNKVYEIAEKMPEFPGGDDKLMNYLSSNIKYPSYAKENEIEGLVMIKFIVNKDGSISDAHVVKGIKGGCDEEALRVVKSVPKWIPAKQKGKKIRVYLYLPIDFRATE
jgi:periplasmic protein TonB